MSCGDIHQAININKLNSALPKHCHESSSQTKSEGASTHHHINELTNVARVLMVPNRGDFVLRPVHWNWRSCNKQVTQYRKGEEDSIKLLYVFCPAPHTAVLTSCISFTALSNGMYPLLLLPLAFASKPQLVCPRVELSRATWTC